MENVWLASAVWLGLGLGLALLASIISIRVAISVALVEIMVGAVAGNIIGLDLTDWVNFLAGFGAILLTFLGRKPCAFLPAAGLPCSCVAALRATCQTFSPCDWRM